MSEWANSSLRGYWSSKDNPDILRVCDYTP